MATLQALRPTKAAAFVELNEEYNTNLAEIRVRIESSELDFHGMEPVVTNLMEIMQNKAAMQKAEVVVAVRNLVQSLLENCRDFVEQLDEEHEHQSALFEHLEKAFNENVARSEKEVEVLKAAATANGKRTQNFATSADHALVLAKHVEELLVLRVHECHNYKNGHAEATVKMEKIAAILTQIEEILINSAQGLHSYFLQREMRKN